MSDSYEDDYYDDGINLRDYISICDNCGKEVNAPQKTEKFLCLRCFGKFIVYIAGEKMSFPKKNQKQNECAVCFKYADKNCSKCKSVKYCSVDCQRKDWPDHKIKCTKL